MDAGLDGSARCTVVIKAALYVVVLAIPVVITGSIGGLLQGLAIRDFVAWMISTDFPLTLLIIYSIHLVVSYA